MSRVEPAHQPAVLSGDACRAVAGVAALSLNAADGHHRLAANMDHVAAQRKAKHGSGRKTQLAGADKNDVVMQPLLEQLAVNANKAELERQRHVVRKDKRCGSRPAFATVDRNVVDSTVALRHGICQVSPELLIADRRLDADRNSAGVVRDLLDKIQH